MKRVLSCLAAPLLALVACATDPAGAPAEPSSESNVEQSVMTAVCIAGSVKSCVGAFADSNAACDRDPTHQCVTRTAVSDTESICICGFPE